MLLFLHFTMGNTSEIQQLPLLVCHRTHGVETALHGMQSAGGGRPMQEPQK
jgi:hypothetical protein